MKKNFNKTSKIIMGVILALIGLAIVLLLIVKCSVKEYIVKFDSKGGTPIESVRVKENGKVKKPEDPKKEGYTFTGWYYNDKLFDFNTKITKDITLEAYYNEDGISVNSDKIALVINSEKQIEILSLPKGVSKSDLEYLSSDEEIATVSSEGVITALKEGKIIITIKTKDGKYQKDIEVTVTLEEIMPTEIAIIGYTSVAVGERIRLLVSYSPDDATNLNFSWESSNPKVAAIDQNGFVTGVSEGTVTITVKSENGLTATYKVSVYIYTEPENPEEDEPTPEDPGTTNPEPENPGTTKPETPGTTEPETPTEVEPTSIKITGPQDVNVNSQITLSASIAPDNATNKTVTWSSSNDSIAKVDGNGNVTGVSEGTVKIKATAANGVSAEYEVRVHSIYTIYITAVPLGGDNLSLGSIQYTYKVFKDGRELTEAEFKGFTYNGIGISSKQSSVPQKAMGEATTAELKLSDDSIVTASVIKQ